MANTSFLDPAFFQETGPYGLMPFRFGDLPSGRILLTNQSGEYLTLERNVFNELLAGHLNVGSPVYLDLKARNFLTHGSSATSLRVAASQWRTKKAFMEGGPKLHIFVPTLRCNQSCGYCQVSRADCAASGVDMTRENASRAIQLMLRRRLRR